MKLWIRDTSTPSHHIIYLTGEDAQDTTFLDDFSDESFLRYIESISPLIDAQKHLKLIRYFGYLHIFAKKEA